MPRLSEIIERKFVDSIPLNEWEIETDTGWHDVSAIHKTVPYIVFRIALEDGTTVQCADTHIFITESGEECYAQDALGVCLQTKRGPLRVVSVECSDEKREMYDVTVDSESHTFYSNDVLSHNTVTAAAAILHYTLFQDNKTVAIIANKGAAAREVLNRYQIMYENLPIWMQQGVKTWNKGDVELENGGKIFTSATTVSSVKGRSINWLYIDETAAIQANVAKEFFASVYPTISSGKTTKVLLTSTPLGYNHFWKYWNEAKPTNVGAVDSFFWNGTEGINGFVRLFIPYWEIPGRDEMWAEEQRKLLGEITWNQEVGCNFLGSSNTLINGSVLGTLSSIEPAHTSLNLDVYKEPVKGRFYVLTADVGEGVGQDYSAFTVVDATAMPYEVVAKYRNNTVSPLLYPNIIHKVAKEYNEAMVMIETNDLGGQVAEILYSELEYENIITTLTDGGKTVVSPGFAKATKLGVKTNKVVKRNGCFALKGLVEERKLLVFDSDVITEFSTFVERNGLYMADSASDNDDLAMCLVLFGWLTTNVYFQELTDIKTRESMFKNRMQQIEDELTPFAISDGQENDYEKMGGDLWKPAI
jgi:hypothetical protein